MAIRGTNEQNATCTYDVALGPAGGMSVAMTSAIAVVVADACGMCLYCAHEAQHSSPVINVQCSLCHTADPHTKNMDEIVGAQEMS